MRKLQRSLAFFALLAVAAAPCFAGIHYKSSTKTQDGTGKGSSNMEVEGWVAGEKARVEFKEAGGNPVAKEGAYLITKDGGKTVYFVDPEEKTYAAWDLQAMLGVAGAVMNGMGPLLKFEFTAPKVEKLLEEDGGMVVGQPTTHYKYRTSYTMKMKVFGMSNDADIVNEQDIWATQKLQDTGLGIWLRSEPPRTGNEQLDKLISSEMGKVQGFPLKTVTVSTTTQKKNNKQTTTRSTMEVTQLDSATPAATAFEIPAGYKETELLPQTGDAGQQGDEQGGLGGLLKRNKKKDNG